MSTFIQIAGSGGGTAGSDKGSFGAVADASAPGIVGYITIPYNGTITGWQVIGDVSGDCVFNIWKASAGVIPTAGDAIATSEKPTLVAQQINSDLNLTTWTTTTINAGDVIAVVLNSASTLSKAWLTVFITKLP
jgi:hypothetical protein